MNQPVLHAGCYQWVRNAGYAQQALPGFHVQRDSNERFVRRPALNAYCRRALHVCFVRPDRSASSADPASHAGFDLRAVSA